MLRLTVIAFNVKKNIDLDFFNVLTRKSITFGYFAIPDQTYGVIELNAIFRPKAST